MRRSSPYYQLKYVVGCKWPQNGFYEPIAAFDSEKIAREYASSRCGLALAYQMHYRVMERTGTGYKLLYTTEQNANVTV